MNDEKMTAPTATMSVATISGHSPGSASFRRRSVVRPRARANATGATMASSRKVPRFRRSLLFRAIATIIARGKDLVPNRASGGAVAARRTQLAAELHQPQHVRPRDEPDEETRLHDGELVDVLSGHYLHRLRDVLTDVHGVQLLTRGHGLEDGGGRPFLPGHASQVLHCEQAEELLASDDWDAAQTEGEH